LNLNFGVSIQGGFGLPWPKQDELGFNKTFNSTKDEDISNLFEDFNLLLRTDEGCEVDIEFRSKSLNVFLNSLPSIEKRQDVCLR